MPQRQLVGNKGHPWHGIATNLQCPSCMYLTQHSLKRATLLKKGQFHFNLVDSSPFTDLLQDTFVAVLFFHISTEVLDSRFIQCFNNVSEENGCRRPTAAYTWLHTRSFSGNQQKPKLVMNAKNHPLPVLSLRVSHCNRVRMETPGPAWWWSWWSQPSCTSDPGRNLELYKIWKYNEHGYVTTMPNSYLGYCQELLFWSNTHVPGQPYCCSSKSLAQASHSFSENWHI